MSAVFKKLQLKDQPEILVLNAPPSFEAEIAQLAGVTAKRAASAVKEVAFSLAFVTTEPEIDKVVSAIAKKCADDPVVWFAYPKGSSRNYTSQLKRDDGWASLGRAGFEPVRMISIDEDWTAVRFRKPQFIKTMTRGIEHVKSKEGRRKVAQQARKKSASR
jgi:hypothetical protein